MWDLLLVGAKLLPLDRPDAGTATIDQGALAVVGQEIAWLGPESALPHRDANETIDLGGALLTPGFIDCHTHLVFADDRADEFERRLTGVGYAEIARAGGGILSTVRRTRAAGQAELRRAAEARLARLQARGVTTVEVKSGYALTLAGELGLLRVARELGRRPGVDVVTTLLAAHAVPPEFAGDRAAYLQLINGPLLDAVMAEGLADAVDVFTEGIAFSAAETRGLVEAATARGLATRLHADQLSDGGGAALAAELGCRSADHLEYASPAGVRAMAAAGTIAVLLPGAFYALRERQPPPVAALREAGVPIAIATDANPGSSPLLDPLLAANLGCVLFGLTVPEVLHGLTDVAASVLGLADRGRLAPGLLADLAAWRVGSPAQLVFWLGADPLELLVKRGRVVSRSAGPRRSPS